MKKIITMLAVISLCHTAPRLSAQSFVVTTIAGDGTDGYSGDGGPGTSAKLFAPSDIAVDATGNVYIADYNNHRIRKVDGTTGIITTIAGNGFPAFYGDGMPATASYLSYPSEVKLDAAGNIYINDGLNNRIRKISAATGIITTIAGSGTSAYHNGMPALSWDTSMRPMGLAVDPAGNCYFMSYGSRRVVVRLDAATGIITPIADSAGTSGFSGDGGPAVDAQVNNLNYYPGLTLTLNASNDIFITDIYNERIRKIDHTTGIITTIAGTGYGGFSGDGGPATAANLSLPNKITIDNAGSIYLFTYARIRKIDGSGIINTIAGGGSSYAEGIPATTAKIYSPYGIATDASRNIYYSDHNGRVRKLTPACSGATPGVITGASALCSGGTTTLTLSGATTGADISYLWQYSTDGITWYNSGTSAPSYTTSPLSTPTYFRVAVTCNSAGVTATAAVDTISIIPTPAAGTITGSDTLCVADSISLADTAAGGIWTSGNTAIAHVSSTGTVTGIASGAAIINYIVTNACGADTASTSVYVRPSGLCSTGISTQAPSATLGIYPNPGNGTFSITLLSAAEEPVQLVITNLTGERVMELTTKSNKENTINLNNAAAGIYFLSAVTPGQQYNAKIVVTK